MIDYLHFTHFCTNSEFLYQFAFVFVCSLFICVLLVCVLGDEINNNKNNDSYRLHPTKRHSRSRSKESHKWGAHYIACVAVLNLYLLAYSFSRARKESRRHKKKKILQEDMTSVSTIAYEQEYQEAKESVVLYICSLESRRNSWKLKGNFCCMFVVKIELVSLM